MTQACDVWADALGRLALVANKSAAATPVGPRSAAPAIDQQVVDERLARVRRTAGSRGGRGAARGGYARPVAPAAASATLATAPSFELRT